MVVLGIIVMAVCYLCGLYANGNNWLLALPLLLIIGGAWAYVRNSKRMDRY